MPTIPKLGAFRDLDLAESTTLHRRWRFAARRRLGRFLILRKTLRFGRVDHANHAQRAVWHAVEGGRVGARDGDGPGLLFSRQ